MKNKFAGFFRGLLRHADDSATAHPVAAAQPAPPPAMSAAAEHHVSQVAEAPMAPAPAGANDIALPLAAIIAHLPMDLKAKLMSVPTVGQAIALPVDKVVSQLAFGSVKISFGELRQLAPGVFANSGGEFDSRPVNLPLQEILSRLNPALLSRKSVQKVDVAEEISGPFDGRGQGISFTTQPLKQVKPTPAPAPVPAPELPAFDLGPARRPASVTPPPAAAPKATVPPRSVTPTATPAPAPAADTEVFTFTPRQTVTPSTPIPFNPLTLPGSNASNGNGHANGNANTNGNNNGHANNNAALPPFKFSAAPAPAAPVTSSAPRPEPAQPVLLVSLDDLAENWPQELKNEIISSNFASASVPFPMSFVEAGLKRGRVTMTWKELRTMIKPSSAASQNDGLQLDLPLKAIAPAFFAAQRQAAKPQKKLAVAEEIPNLFFGFPQAAPAEPEPVAPSRPAAPVASAVAFAPEPVVAPAKPTAPAVPVAPVAPAAPVATPYVHPKVADTNFYVWGENGELPQADELTMKRGERPATDFLSRHAHPKDIVARAMMLPGVGGAVVALADGLRVASQVPAEMNADAVSAFLPQIFERVNQTTRELRMGALNNVSFTIGNLPWKIFRVNSVYFAVFGRMGEVMPTSQLAVLAAELDRKKQI